MGVGNGIWIVRHRHKASKPMRLTKAKACALEMVAGVWDGRVLTDPIKNLHQETLKAMGEEPFCRPPLNIMGCQHKWERTCKVERETIAVILRTECPMLVHIKPQPQLPVPSPSDDYPISYDSDGYPLLPECLNRRENLQS